MVSVESNSVRVGAKIEMDGDCWVVTDLTHVSPGKGQAFTAFKFKSLTTGRVQQKNIRSTEKMETADVYERNMEFLYRDDEFHFMDLGTYDQIAIPPDGAQDAADYLKENLQVSVVFWNDKPITINLPASVDLTVTYTEPGLRGDTATGATKVAELETGLKIQVPLFIEQDEVIKVDTRTGEYLSRA